MLSDTAWPAIEWESHPWTRASADAGLSRTARARHSGPYQAAVPARIKGLTPDIPDDVAALTEDATVEVARFDAEVGADVAPFAAILLRSESAASSQIENLTSG